MRNEVKEMDKVKSVEVVAYFDSKGHPRPQRLRLSREAEERQIIKIDEIITRELSKKAGNEMFIFYCRSIIDRQSKEYVLKYEKDTCLWLLEM